MYNTHVYKKVANVRTQISLIFTKEETVHTHILLMYRKDEWRAQKTW